MRKVALRAVATACLLTVTSCGGNSAPSDPGPVEYSRVQAIFNARCGGGACHIGSTPELFGGSLDLSAAQAGPCSINISSQQDPMRMRVVPGQPDASYLLCKVDPSCSSLLGSRMPVGAPLPSDDVAVLRAWIQQGATGAAAGTCATNPSGGGPDTTAPTFAGATGASSAPNSITVQWSAATDNATTQDQLVYQLYQATAAGGEMFSTPSYTTAPGATSFSIGKLPINTRYYYVVRARDQAGNVDTNTAEVSATTPATSDMQAPTFAGLTTAAASGVSITLSWTAATDTVSQAAQITYLVYQATAAGAENFAMPSYTTPAGATSYTVNGLAPNTTYYFVVRAQDAAGNTDTNRTERSAKTANVSLSGQVQPIFTRDCTSGACHGSRNPAQGLDLSSAAASYSNLVNIASTQCAMNKRVLPMQPDMSYLMWKLQGSGPCFSGSQMPKGQPLSSADQAAIRGWIAAGAPNN